MELVDTLSWGGSGLSLVGVRVPPSAPFISNFPSISIPSRPFFWSTAEIREKTISVDYEVTSQVTVLVTLSKIKTTTESVPCQRPFISSASPLPAPISFVAPFHWICAITLTADKNSEYLWQANQRLALNEQLVVYTPSLQISAVTRIDLTKF